jgi:hypothetical protein
MQVGGNRLEVYKPRVRIPHGTLLRGEAMKVRIGETVIGKSSGTRYRIVDCHIEEGEMLYFLQDGGINSKHVFARSRKDLEELYLLPLPPYRHSSKGKS